MNDGGYQSITIHHYYDWISITSGFIPLDPQLEANTWAQKR